MYTPTVEYTDPAGTRHRFSGSIASSPPAYDRGERVTVRFDPVTPENARIDSFAENWFGVLLFGGMGATFFTIGAVYGVVSIRKVRNRSWLRVHGTRIQARYIGVVHDTSMTANGRSPYRLTAQWEHPTTGAIHVFQSDPIWYEPSAVVRRETLEVLVKADDPTVYEVDIRFLPKSA